MSGFSKTQTRLTASTNGEEMTTRNCCSPVVSQLSPRERRAGVGKQLRSPLSPRVGGGNPLSPLGGGNPLSPRGGRNPLSSRGRGAENVINEEKDRMLHSALRRTNLAAALNDPQVRMYIRCRWCRKMLFTFFVIEQDLSSIHEYYKDSIEKRTMCCSLIV